MLSSEFMRRRTGLITPIERKVILPAGIDAANPGYDVGIDFVAAEAQLKGYRPGDLDVFLCQIIIDQLLIHDLGQAADQFGVGRYCVP